MWTPAARTRNSSCHMPAAEAQCMKLACMCTRMQALYWQALDAALTLKPVLVMQLEVIQSRLLDVGSAIATPVDKSPEYKLQRVAFDVQATSKLEVCLRGWYDII